MLPKAGRLIRGPLDSSGLTRCFLCDGEGAHGHPVRADFGSERTRGPGDLGELRAAPPDAAEHRAPSALPARVSAASPGQRPSPAPGVRGRSSRFARVFLSVCDGFCGRSLATSLPKRRLSLGRWRGRPGLRHPDPPCRGGWRGQGWGGRRHLGSPRREHLPKGPLFLSLACGESWVASWWETPLPRRPRPLVHKPLAGL